jgi:hypothetical protein
MPYIPTNLENSIAIGSPDYLSLVVNTVNTHGYARFNNVNTPEGLVLLSRALGEVSVHSMTDEQGVTTLTTLPEVSDAAAGVYKPDYELMPHTDGSAMEKPSSLIVLSCPHPDPTGGGRSMMVDGKTVYEQLALSDPQLLEELRRPDAATFGATGQFTGAVFERGKDGMSSVRFRYDDQVTFNRIPRDRLAPMLAIMGANEVSFGLGRGQGYVIDNSRMLHGRTQITGPRTVIRTHVEPRSGPQALMDERFRLGFLAEEPS